MIGASELADADRDNGWYCLLKAPNSSLMSKSAVLYHAVAESLWDLPSPSRKIGRWFFLC
jgi:hypothetical protein